MRLWGHGDHLILKSRSMELLVALAEALLAVLIAFGSWYSIEKLKKSGSTLPIFGFFGIIHGCFDRSQ